MSKPIGFFGQTGAFAGSPLAPLDRVFELTGLNTGNIAFFHAVRSHIANPVTVLPWLFNPDIVNERCSALVMPAANMINAFQNHSRLAEVFSRLRVPVAVVGLGVQLPLGAKPDSLQLQDGTRQFIRTLADIGAHVGCRGETTRQVLALHGLDATITGCPSNFTNPRTDLGIHVAGKYGPLLQGLLVHCDYNARLRPINERLVRWIGEHGGMVSIQDPDRGFRLAVRDPAALSHPDTPADIEAIFGVPREHAVRFAVDKFITLADWSSWTFYSRSFSLSLGTRMHGNMIAFQAEVPTILFPHDARVDELSATMRLPRVPLAAAVGAERVETLFEALDFDGATYDANRRALAQGYFGILRSTGVQIEPRFAQLASEGSQVVPLVKAG